MRRKTIQLFLLLLCISVCVLPAWAAEALVPVGRIVGLELCGGSVNVAAYEDGLCQSAKAAGLQIGDEIVAIDDHPIRTVGDVRRALNLSDGQVTLTVLRKGRELALQMEPAITDQGPRLGVYIREGIAGVGTVTWFDPQTMRFGALGHGINGGSGAPVPLKTGKVYRASVISVKAGRIGEPGQLRGGVDSTKVLGSLTANTAQGVFGEVTEPWKGEAIPVAAAGQIREGPAVIRSNVVGDQVREYTVEIVKVYTADRDEGRNMLLKVTDPTLLATTGGIVQGMSGSPIIQDGKLVGAVTHVLVNDPTTGYGIFIENMLDAAA